MKSSSTSISQMLRLFSVVLLATFADAFRTSATAVPPMVAPLDLPSKDTIRSPQTQPTVPTRRKFKYDLGIGKNKPIINTRPKETLSTDLDPARFWSGHESVRSYPSPLDSNFVSNSQTKSNRRKNLPKVQHRRHSEDVLSIWDPSCAKNGERSDCCDDNDDNSCHPVIIPTLFSSAGNNVQAAKLDVNTVWVEMMLHNEQKKFVSQ